MTPFCKGHQSLLKSPQKIERGKKQTKWGGYNGLFFCSTQSRFFPEWWNMPVSFMAKMPCRMVQHLKQHSNTRRRAKRRCFAAESFQEPPFSRRGAALAGDSWIKLGFIISSFQQRELRAHKKNSLTLFEIKICTFLSLDFRVSAFFNFKSFYSQLLLRSFWFLLIFPNCTPCVKVFGQATPLFWPSFLHKWILTFEEKEEGTHKYFSLLTIV